MQGNAKLIRNLNSETKLRAAKFKALIALFLMVERRHKLIKQLLTCTSLQGGKRTNENRKT